MVDFWRENWWEDQLNIHARMEGGAGGEGGVKKTFTVLNMAGKKQGFPPSPTKVYVDSLWPDYAHQIGQGQSYHCSNPQLSPT